MKIEKSTMKGLGLAAAIFAFLVGQFWGVPTYIRYVVIEENKKIAASTPTPNEIVELTTQMEAVEKGIDRLDGNDARIEGKIDHLTGLFIADLNRRASQ